jgi:hypothetical protein
VCAILPMDVWLIQQTEIGFVNQRGSLQDISRLSPAALLMGQPVEFVVNQRHQLAQRSVIPVTPFLQEHCDPMRGKFH